MQRRLRIAAAALATALMTAGGMGVLAPAANAANSGSTTATFSVTGGTLGISVPASTVSLGSTAAGTLNVAGALGNTTVSDQRGALTATWTVTVSSTDFVTGGASTNETVTKSNVAYSAGLASGSGSGAFTPGVIATLASPGTGAAWAGVGVNTQTWNPTMSFTLLPSQVTGTYTGSITQSVA
jgi:hypothetical protein